MPQVDFRTVELAKQGDAGAHARLYETFAPMVFTIARRMLASAALAEDMLQETFVEVIRNVSTYRGDAEFGYWIRRVAINCCLAQLRSPWFARRSDQADLQLAAASRCDDQIELARALDALSATARAVVWLHDVEGFTHREIAEMTRRSPSFSKSQLARAHERLRALLEQEPQRGESLACKPVLKTC